MIKKVFILLAYFITLTYNDESLPRTKEGYPTLLKKQVQDYIKRLRNAHVAYLKKEQRKVHNEYKITGKPIRYYAVGEYGSQTRRPHYHILLFNYEIDNTSQFVMKKTYSSIIKARLLSMSVQ